MADPWIASASVATWFPTRAERAGVALLMHLSDAWSQNRVGEDMTLILAMSGSLRKGEGVSTELGEKSARQWSAFPLQRQLNAWRKVSPEEIMDIEKLFTMNPSVNCCLARLPDGIRVPGAP
jgi:hypothetical protein